MTGKSRHTDDTPHQGPILPQLNSFERWLVEMVHQQIVLEQGNAICPGATHLEPKGRAN